MAFLERKKRKTERGETVSFYVYIVVSREYFPLVITSEITIPRIALAKVSVRPLLTLVHSIVNE